MNAETQFFLRKLDFDYGNPRALKELKEISKKVTWLKGWPRDKAAFWNGEAFMWRNKLSPEKRELIRQELGFLEKKQKKNLDLGCGSYSYINSTGLDISEKMLLLNGNLIKGIKGDLEEKLPFPDQEFDSVTLVFVLDYVKNCPALLAEVFRVLKKKGALVIVQGKTEGWWKKKQVNDPKKGELTPLLKKEGFKVRCYKKRGLWFFKGEKSKII